MECLGCGMSHAFIDLLQGDFSAAYSHNPLIFPFLALVFTGIKIHYSKFQETFKPINS
tara:strand:- start:58 stop:231 length:174 start_codon:yes stop_codon:yes gene_type:complete